MDGDRFYMELRHERGLGENHFNHGDVEMGRSPSLCFSMPIAMRHQSPEHKLQGIMKSVKANHLTGKLSLKAMLIVLFVSCLTQLQHTETQTGGLILLQNIFWKREQSGSAWQARLVLHLRKQIAGTPKIYFCTEGLRFL